jgi:hypothetical protein
MKNLYKVLGIIALVAVIGFSFAACDNGDDTGGQQTGEGVPQKATYVSKDSNGNTYTLEIDESGGRSARSAAQTGDTFKLTVEYTTVVGSGNLNMKFEYSGTVGAAQTSGARVSLTLNINGETITITIVGTEMTVITGKIVNNNGQEVVNNPGNVTPVNGGGDQTFTSIAAFKTWLDSQSTNTIASPYNVRINISNLSGPPSLKSVLTSNTNKDKYVNIDLSGSTFTSIADYAFQDCKSLTSVTIPNSVTSIGAYAFSGSTNLTSVTIGNNVTSIGIMAFYSCPSLTSVTFTATSKVTSIGNRAFDGCSSLTSITLPNSVTSIGNGAFQYCTNLSNVTLPNSVTSIEGYAFRDCTNLSSVTIGSSVVSIEGGAFMNCTNLTSVTFLGTIPSSGFSGGGSGNPTFPGDLRAKFYATNTTNGTPGTYTRAGTVWTKQ